MERRRFLRQVGLALLSSGCRPAPSLSQPRSRSPRDRALAIFQSCTRRARARLRGRPIGPPAPIPDELRGIDYDLYRSIRFRPERALWRGGPFEAQFFHRGFYYGRAVDVRVHDASGGRPHRFDPADFAYPDPLVPERFEGLGFAGLRLHAPINTASYSDEVLVFLGASYFRSLGRGNVYGLSARCLGVDTGREGTEEFPEIVALHLVTPNSGDDVAHLVAEARSPRVEGAFRFELAPGSPTTIDVEAAVFPREAIDQLGLAPLTSMYLFGEDRPGRFGDHRPEVHDSDGLLLHTESGERIFRPLRNPPRTTHSSFRVERPHAFGLVQRDRDVRSYQDPEARYERRPSAIVTPIEGWTPGSVRLLEIATRLETDDNVGAFFVPDEWGDELRYRYRVAFGDPSPVHGAHVVALRTGRPEATVRPDAHGPNDGLFVVDWAGAPTADAVEARVDCEGARVVRQRLERDDERGLMRLVIQLEAERPDVELRAFLHHGSDALGETLSYLWQPEPAN
ncbi:MAG: glucan biosynthesis protein [Deltaproteobacteria bacterium]|nr:glucan biosynthesis protein [Deltaproteobacteria bacterium]